MSGLVSGIFGGGSSSGNGASQQQTVTNEPPGYLQPFLATAAQNSQNAYQQYIAQNMNQPYTGAPNQLAPNISALTPQPTAATLAGQASGLNTANLMNGEQQNTNNIASGLQANIANGMFQAPSNMTFQPMSDKNLQASIAAQLAPLQQQLTDVTLPSLKSQAINEGAYGGSRADVMNNMALKSYDTAATNATAQATEQFDAQNSALEEQNLANRISAATTGNQQTLQGDALIPSLQNTGAQQGATQSSLQTAVGQQQQSQDAANIAAEMQYYSNNQASPFGGLGELESLLQGTNSGGTSTSSVPAPGLLSQLTSGLGGISSIASILGGGSNISNIFGGLNSGLGAVSNIGDPLAGLYGVSGGTAGAVNAAGDSIAAASSGGSGIMDALMALFAA